MRAKSVFFHAVILSAILGTAALGVWQLHRREWKHALIADYEAAQKNPPQTLHGGTLDAAKLWHKFYVTGTIDYDRAVLLPAYIQESDKICGIAGWGYRLVAPVILSNGQTLLYQDGFIPNAVKNTPPRGKQSGRLTVSIWPLRAPSWMPPRNDPARGQWMMLDQSIYDAWHVPRQPIYLNSEFDGMVAGGPDEGSSECDYPVNYWRAPIFTDDHLQYAITWFALAAVLAGMYVFRQFDGRQSR